MTSTTAEYGNSATIPNSTAGSSLSSLHDSSRGRRRATEVDHPGTPTGEYQSESHPSTPLDPRLLSVSGPGAPAFTIVGMLKWEGRITDIEDGLLTAELVPLDHDGPTLHADFVLSLLAPDDTVARVGDVVYLTARTVVNPGGYRTHTSTLRLKRTGKWTQSELDAIRDKAREKLRSFLQYVE